jgi:hypothetical protein
LEGSFRRAPINVVDEDQEKGFFSKIWGWFTALFK